jgi:peroxiredoxin Q/BCP
MVRDQRDDISMGLDGDSRRLPRVMRVLNAGVACVNIRRRSAGDLLGKLDETRAFMSATCEAGEPAPDFDLAAEGEKRVRLADFRGHALALYFYPKDDTSGCTAEAIAFNALRKDFAEIGAAIIGVSPDSPKSHAKFKTKYSLELDLGADEEKSVATAYGVWVEKSMYGRKYMGVERSTFLIGPDGRIARVWRKVKVPGHAEEVLAAARALKSGKA